MNFEEQLNLWRNGASRQQVPPGWSQGRATFGGLVAAMLYEQMAARVTGDASLRSLTFSFVAPVATGEVEVSANTLRAGRSATQVEGRAFQDGAAVLAAFASFGSGRESVIAVDPAPAPTFSAPEESPALPYIHDLVPEFTRHFDYRIAAGDMPFSGSPEPRLGGWVRFSGDAPQAPASVSHLLALIDAWPPALLPMLKQPAPASSLTWTVEFIEPLPAQGVGDWWQYLAEVEQAGDGYGVAQARLWDAGGRLVAFTRQTVTVFG